MATSTPLHDPKDVAIYVNGKEIQPGNPLLPSVVKALLDPHHGTWPCGKCSKKPATKVVVDPHMQIIEGVACDDCHPTWQEAVL